ncbi:hypothetical protein T484DRAFT_2369297 [Baffinella frigidus]|nr:hypothetical protein T484DRAFT_2369297 [Cryptophyta sp. CCMP2293]
MASEPPAEYQSLTIPETGKWNNPDICGCCATTAGCKSCCMAVCWGCCGPCLYARLSARIKWPNSFEFLGSTLFQRWFRLTLALVLVYWVSGWMASLLDPEPDTTDFDHMDWSNITSSGSQDLHKTPAAAQFFSAIQSLTGLVWLVMVIQLRAGMRKKYSIPARCCATGDVCCSVDCEDILCACFCMSCTLSQMAQHTQAVDESPCNCCDADVPVAEAPKGDNSMA